MKRKFWILFIPLVLISVVIFAQDGGLSDILENLGIGKALASVLGVVGLWLIGNVVIPTKWAAPFLWFQKILEALLFIVKKINEKTNVDIPTIRKRRAAAKVGMLAMLFLIPSAAFSQGGPGFFKPMTGYAVQQKIEMRNISLRAEGEQIEVKAAWFLRPAVALTAVAVDLSTRPVTTSTLSSVGTGVSYGKFSIVEGADYCNFSVNALLLTGVVLKDQVSTKIGGAVVADAFNKLVGLGLGYLDGSVVLLTTISYSF